MEKSSGVPEKDSKLEKLPRTEKEARPSTVRPSPAKEGGRKMVPSPSAHSPLKRTSPGAKTAQGQSPNKISWLRASDEELLQRLRSIPREPTTGEDECGSCVNDIVQLLQDKLQKLIEEKLSQRQAKKDSTNYLRTLNDDTTRLKSELYNADKYMAKLQAEDAKAKDEIAKLDVKIQEIDGQMQSVAQHGSKITQEERNKLKVATDRFAQLSDSLQANADKENAVLEALTKQEQDLLASLEKMTQDCDNLQKQLNALRDKEAQRQQAFKSVSETIEGMKSSKALN